VKTIRNSASMSTVFRFKTCFSDVFTTAMVLMQLTGDVWET